MSSPSILSKKVILIGNFGVGKTSLTRRFVYQKFSDEYLTTLGVRIDKKEVNVGNKSLHLILWDIAGEVSQEKVNKSYYLGAHAVIYVFDICRPTTYMHLAEDIAYVHALLPKAPCLIVANKYDLYDKDELPHLPLPIDFVSSAKTGHNVEELFQVLAQRLLAAPPQP